MCGGPIRTPPVHAPSSSTLSSCPPLHPAARLVGHVLHGVKDLGTTKQEPTHTMHVSIAMGGTDSQEVDCASLKKECTCSVMISANIGYPNYHPQRERMDHKQAMHKQDTKKTNRKTNAGKLSMSTVLGTV